ncbi:MAG: helix-turn-helix domain-containing protein [Chloroflexi bacterium]|nr:helix-turn-helix domain-containing protein [Chloroflexota bacterium]
MDTIKDDELILDFREAMVFLRCSRQKLYKLMVKGAIKGYKVGSTRVFYKRDLKDLIRECPPPPSFLRLTSDSDGDS